jgi:RNA polymerase sigma-70 factor (ECF subfamily)
MPSGSGNRHPPLALIRPTERVSEIGEIASERDGKAAPRRDLDWSILMAHAQAGDREAYRRLLADIAPYVRALASRCHRNASDVEDCVQDILFCVHAVRHTYDPIRPFGPWLVAIANRRIADRLRRQIRSTSREIPLDEGHEGRLAADISRAEALSDARALRDAIERLPQGQRDAVRMLKLQELSLREASALSGMSIAALKTATHRAVKSLRRMLR